MADDGKRIALVSGANKGIGLQIARQLAQAGLHVLIGARKAELGKAAEAQLCGEGLDGVQFIELDLARAGTMQAAAARI